MVRVLERIVAAWLEPEVVDGCPRSPRVVGDVDHEVLAPVSVDLGGRHPLPVHEARGCIGFSAKNRDEMTTASLRFGDQPSAVRYSGRAYSCPRGTRASHILVAECGSLPEPPRGSCSARTCCRTDTSRRCRWRPRSRRSASRWGPGRRHPAPCASASTGRTPPGRPGSDANRAHRGIGSTGSFTISTQYTQSWPIPISPPIGQYHFVRTLPVPSPTSNGSGLFGVPRCSSVKQLPVCISAALCTKRAGRGRHGPRVVEERVLEQPEVAIVTHRIDVLVVPTQHRAEPRREELVAAPAP